MNVTRFVHDVVHVSRRHRGFGPRTCGICKRAEEVETQASLRHAHAAHVQTIQVLPRLRRLQRSVRARMHARITSGSPGATKAAAGLALRAYATRPARSRSSFSAPSLWQKSSGAEAVATRGASHSGNTKPGELEKPAAALRSVTMIREEGSGTGKLAIVATIQVQKPGTRPRLSGCSSISERDAGAMSWERSRSKFRFPTSSRCSRLGAREVRGGRDVRQQVRLAVRFGDE
jgi:hypothetical protein